MMRRPNGLVVISSDEEDDVAELFRASRSIRSESKSSGGCEKARPAKAPRISSSTSKSYLTKDWSNVDEARLSFEDFDEALSGLKIPAAGPSCRKSEELWVDKYRPHSLEELAVHKKKITEVMAWLEDRLSTPKYKCRGQFLMITGKAGIGKSAAVRVIASHIGINLYEWNSPTPTMWLEYKHNSSTGLDYISKLDEFEKFVERTRKYGLISSSVSEASRCLKTVLIDDLPATNGRPSFQRLQKCLLFLARSALVPTILLITNYGESDSAEKMSWYLEELQSSLEDAGACKIAFNPITKNCIKKVLANISRKEGCSITPEEIDLLASSSGGDIRYAITSLQLVCLKPEHHFQKDNMKLCSYVCTNPGENKLMLVLDSRISHFSKDETLSLFHALGKFLHNKRETKNAGSGWSEYLLHQRFSRFPLKMETPEKILCQAHGQARHVVEFLHENVLDFVDDEAIDDAWAVSSYLAVADVLLASFQGMLARHNKAGNILQSAAASVAVRGVLYGNSHSSPSRWHAIRRPKLWEIEQLASRNKDAGGQRSLYYNKLGLTSASILATEYTPALRWLSFGASNDWPRGETQANDNEACRNLDEQESESEDDDIEDW